MFRYVVKMNEYNGSEVEIRISAENLKEAKKKARIIMEASREVIDADEGFEVVDLVCGL